MLLVPYVVNPHIAPHYRGYEQHDNVLNFKMELSLKLLDFKLDKEMKDDNIEHAEWFSVEHVEQWTQNEFITSDWTRRIHFWT